VSSPHIAFLRKIDGFHHLLRRLSSVDRSFYSGDFRFRRFSLVQRDKWQEENKSMKRNSSLQKNTGRMKYFLSCLKVTTITVLALCFNSNRCGTGAKAEHCT